MFMVLRVEDWMWDWRLEHSLILHPPLSSGTIRAFPSSDHHSCWWDSVWSNFTFLSHFEIQDCWGFLLKRKQPLCLWSPSFPEAALVSIFYLNPDGDFCKVLSSLVNISPRDFHFHLPLPFSNPTGGWGFSSLRRGYSCGFSTCFRERLTEHFLRSWLWAGRGVQSSFPDLAALGKLSKCRCWTELVNFLEDYLPLIVSSGIRLGTAGVLLWVRKTSSGLWRRAMSCWSRRADVIQRQSEVSPGLIQKS